jgi:hypothetical protein
MKKSICPNCGVDSTNGTRGEVSVVCLCRTRQSKGELNESQNS